MAYKIELDDLVNMVAHPCHFCSYIKEGQCSENDGCERGIRAYLEENLNEICDSES